MRIEEAIKQESFDDEVEKLAINIIYTANWLSGKVNQVLKKNNLTSQQFNVLRILKGQYPKPASIILIKERMLDRESNASRLVDKLVATGLVTRIQCPNDRRQVEVKLTDKGLSLLKQVSPLVKNEIRDRLNVSDADAVKLNEGLDAMRLAD